LKPCRTIGDRMMVGGDPFVAPFARPASNLTTIGLPAICCSGLPGSRAEAWRAG
jgi:hypothetical protein